MRDDKKAPEEESILKRQRRGNTERGRERGRGEWSFMVIEVVTGLKSLLYIGPGYLFCVCVKPQC